MLGLKLNHVSKRGHWRMRHLVRSIFVTRLAIMRSNAISFKKIKIENDIKYAKALLFFYFQISKIYVK